MVNGRLKINPVLLKKCNNIVICYIIRGINPKRSGNLFTHKFSHTTEEAKLVSEQSIAGAPELEVNRDLGHNRNDVIRGHYSRKIK
jgi:hypothetical protein